MTYLLRRRINRLAGYSRRSSSPSVLYTHVEPTASHRCEPIQSMLLQCALTLLGKPPIASSRWAKVSWFGDWSGKVAPRGDDWADPPVDDQIDRQRAEGKLENFEG